MGPFELMDLVGIDVGFEVAKSFNELRFGEPRWRPNPIQARMVRGRPARAQDGPRLLRLRGGGEHRPADPEPLEPGGGEDRAVAIIGTARWPTALRERARGGRLSSCAGRPGRAVVDAGVRPTLPAEVRRCSCCAPTAACAARGNPDAVGFHVLPPIADAGSSS